MGFGDEQGNVGLGLAVISCVILASYTDSLRFIYFTPEVRIVIYFYNFLGYVVKCLG